MANQQLKRLLRRGPEMEEAEFELLQSRVLSRLNKTVPEPADDPPVTEAGPEPSAPAIEAGPSVPAIEAGPSLNGTHAETPAPVLEAESSTNGSYADVPTDLGHAEVSTNGTHADPPLEPDGPDSRIRSVKVTTYDLPATAVPVMEEPSLPDWDLAALPMIVSGPSRKVTVIVHADDDDGPTAPAERSTKKRRPTKRPRAERPAATAATAATVEPAPPVTTGFPVPMAAAPAEPPDLPIDAPAATTDAPAATTEAPTAAPTRVRPARPAVSRTPRPPVKAAPVEAAFVAPVQPIAAAIPYCPYCALRLDPPPTTSRRCTRCHERIIVKRVEGRVIYLTEASVAVFDAERRRMTHAGRWTRERSRWLKVAATVGAPPERIARLESAPISAEVVSASEALYTTTVERSFRAARRDRRWEDASRIRREQAQVLFRFAGSPVPPPDDIVRLHREGAAAQLRGIEEMTRQAELVSAGCCDACRADGGQTFKISLERRAPRLPHAGCPKGLCRCDWYLPVRDQTMVRRQLRRRARADQSVPTPGA